MTEREPPCEARPPLHALDAPPPLILLAPPRSFSSVVSAMLGQHPGIYAFPELHIFFGQTLGDVYSAGGPGHRERMISGHLRALAEVCWGGQSHEALEQAHAWLLAHRHWTGEQFFDLLRARVAPRLGLEKSGNTVLDPAALRRADAAYPQARYLHLTRHPRTAIPSLGAMLARGQPGRAADAHVLAAAALCWSQAHWSILAFTAALPPGQALRVRGEALLNAPATVLPAALAWLGLPADDAALAAMTHPEESPYASVGPEGARWGNDPHFLERPLLRAVPLPGRVEAPPVWGLPAALAGEVAAVGRALGYGPTAPRTAPPPTHRRAKAWRRR